MVSDQYRIPEQNTIRTMTVTGIRTGERNMEKELFISSYHWSIYSCTSGTASGRKKQGRHRVVSTSSQWCQGITDFQESKDKITWQILRNAIGIKSDLSTFPRWKFCPDSEENWVHSCSVNPCSETKAGHATAEKNQKETTQNETLLSFGKVRKSRYQGVLQPLLCVQPPWALFH